MISFQPMQGMPQPPPMVPQFNQEAQDAENIKLLVIFHYVMAALTVVCSCLPLFYLVTGVVMLSGKILMPPPGPGGGPAFPDMEFIGWMCAGFGGFFTMVAWALAGLGFYAGKMLSGRRRWAFVFVVACFQCISIPLGTALGVFTIVVLNRPSVKALFEQGGGRDGFVAR